MGEIIRIKHVDCENCLICGKHIGTGNDPALCSEYCQDMYEFECNYNRWAKEQSIKDREEAE